MSDPVGDPDKAEKLAAARKKYESLKKQQKKKKKKTDATEKDDGEKESPSTPVDEKKDDESKEHETKAADKSDDAHEAKSEVKDGSGDDKMDKSSSKPKDEAKEPIEGGDAVQPQGDKAAATSEATDVETATKSDEHSTSQEEGSSKNEDTEKGQNQDSKSDVDAKSGRGVPSEAVGKGDKKQPSIADNDDAVTALRKELQETRQERDDALDKIKKLESRIKALASENAILRSQLDDQSNSDLTLSPPLDTARVGRPRSGSNRPRKTSFVEVELYGEASKISDIRRQMEQWRGYQVDMRQWRSMGIGPAIDL